MATTHENVRLEDDGGNVLMYFPIASTIEEVWQNSVEIGARPWDKGGSIAIDVKMWAGEIVIQGSFVSSDEAHLDPTYVTALRAIPGAPAGWVAPAVITARMIYDFLLEKILETDEFILFYNGAEYGYAAANVDLAEGKFPPVVPKELRVIGEGSRDKIDFTLRLTIAQVELPTS